MFLALALACTEPPEDPTGPRPPAARGPRVVAGPTLGPAPEPALLAGWFQLATDVPTTLTLRVEGPGAFTARFPVPTTEHAVPVLGLRADETYTVSAVVEDADGDAVELPPLTLHAGPGPAPLPTFTALVAEEWREPGFLVMPVAQGDTGFLIALDREARVVFALATGAGLNGVARTPSGDWSMVQGPEIVIRDLLGGVRRRYTATPRGPEDREVPWEDFHHDAVVLEDGSVVGLAFTHARVDTYPLSYSALDQFGPAEIRDDLVVHLSPEGEILGEWSMLDLLDPQHIGFDSLEPARSGALDWVHANAVGVDEAGLFTVSLRHQDAVIRFGPAGDLRWIFGSPFGWPEALEPYLLAPTDPAFVWPTHQHAAELEPDGTLRMFDNGNDERSTPYRESGQVGSWSRLLEVRIDEAAGTFDPVLQRVASSTGALYAGSLGNADRLPVTDGRLATFGTLPRIVEWDAAGEVVLDLQLTPGSWRVDRAFVLSELYPPDVVVTRE